MSIHFRLKSQTYVCNLCGDKCDADSLPDWWLEIENRRAETLQHLCVSCTEDAMASALLMKIEMNQQCQPPHTS